MDSLILIAVGNIVVWGVIIGLMFRLAARERNLHSDLADLEVRIKGS